MAKKSLYFRTGWYLLCYCCSEKHPSHRNSKSRVYPLRCQDSRTPTRRYTAAAAAAVAVRCCCCCGLGTHTHTVPLTSGWRVYIPRPGTHAQQTGPDIYRFTAVTAQTLRNTTSYILLQLGFTSTPARCWAALSGVSCPSVRAAKAVSLRVSRTPPLGMFVLCLGKRPDHSGRYRQ